MRAWSGTPLRLQAARSSATVHLSKGLEGSDGIASIVDLAAGMKLVRKGRAEVSRVAFCDQPF